MRKIVASVGCAIGLSVCAFAFDGSISSSRLGDTWTFSVHNNELIGSAKRPHAVFVSLDVSQDITNMVSPPGWDFETDYRTYIVWVFLEGQPISVTPAPQSNLSGFSFTATNSFAAAAPMYIGSYDSIAMTEGEDFVGTTIGPADCVGGFVSGNLTLDSYDQQLQPYAMPFHFRDINTDEIVRVSVGYIAPDGFFAVKAPVTPGTYLLTCKDRSFLRKSWTVTTSPSGVVGLSGIALNGDIDGDNEVNLVDYSLLSNAFGSTEGDPNWNENADLNNDIEVNLIDFGILSANFGAAGD